MVDTTNNPWISLSSVQAEPDTDVPPLLANGMTGKIGKDTSVTLPGELVESLTFCYYVCSYYHA